MRSAAAIAFLVVLLGAWQSGADEASEMQRLNGLALDLMLRGQARVTAVAEESPAARAGIVAQDRILLIDGKRSKHVFERLRDSHAGAPVLRIARGDQELEVALPRQIGCEHGTLIVASGSVDTGFHDNGTEILVPTGLLRFVRDDDELGLRIAASAGYDVSKAAAYWDHYAAEQFWKISSDMDGLYIPHGAMSLRAPVIRTVQAELTSPGLQEASAQ